MYRTNCLTFARLALLIIEKRPPIRTTQCLLLPLLALTDRRCRQGIQHSSPMEKRDIESGAGGCNQLARPPQQMIMQPPQEKWFPWLVPCVFIANTAIFLYTMYVNNCPASTGGDLCVFYSFLGRFSVQPLTENPLFGPSTTTLERLGGLEVKLIIAGENWRLLSCMWLHAGAIHLLANMFSLLFIGIRLEQEFGFFRIGLLYLLAGLGGSLASCFRLNELSISVGASGALFGLLGAMLSELITNWTIYTNKCGAFVTLLIIIVVNLAVGCLPNMDGLAHFGGFFSGFLLGFVILMRPQFGYVSRRYIPPGYDAKQVKSKHKCYQYCLWVFAFVLLIIGYGTCLALVLGVHKLKH